MKQGFLWYDNDPKKSLQDKLADAAGRFKAKFGIDPTICYVNPTHIEKGQLAFGKFKVIQAPTVQPNHLWFEIEK